mmetsp:Transcript_8953/g.19982  ORF Transcript_8953/g.19982 Transcript_8953/m.19982 type:complete len:249 (-) Transcript_8953:364-1110(-)
MSSSLTWTMPISPISSPSPRSAQIPASPSNPVMWSAMWFLAQVLSSAGLPSSRPKRTPSAWPSSLTKRYPSPSRSASTGPAARTLADRCKPLTSASWALPPKSSIPSLERRRRHRGATSSSAVRSVRTRICRSSRSRRACCSRQRCSSRSSSRLQSPNLAPHGSRRRPLRRQRSRQPRSRLPCLLSGRSALDRLPQASSGGAPSEGPPFVTSGLTADDFPHSVRIHKLLRIHNLGSTTFEVPQLFSDF